MLNFQRMAVEQGTNFGNECIKALQYAGFEIECVEKHIEEVGITLDAVTRNRLGVLMAWEFKGSWQGCRPSLMRTDTVKKAIANAVLLSTSQYADLFPPLLVMCSHKPIKGDAFLMLDAGLNAGLLSAVVDSRDGTFLAKLANTAKDDIASVVERAACAALGKATKAIPKAVRQGGTSKRKLIDAAQLSFCFAK